MSTDAGVQTFSGTRRGAVLPWTILGVCAGALLLLVTFALGFYLRPRIYTETPERITAQFHNLYYNNFRRTWESTFWLGTPIEKCPMDLVVVQEIIQETRPDVIIETGTFKGGATLFYATMFDLLKIDKGRVISVDIVEQPNRPQHSRITYLKGSSVAPEVVSQIKGSIGTGEKVMVVLDSDHSKAHVLKELRAYSPLVTKGNYLIVEDTNLNGHTVIPQFGPGPAEAIQEFFRADYNTDYLVDTQREKFYLTFNPGGFLKKIK